MFACDSIFRPSRRLPHIVLRWKGGDPFVFQRRPQLSNDSTSHIEKRPGLAFESQGFRQKSAFLDQHSSRVDCVFHEHLLCVCRGAQDHHAHSFRVTRLAGLDSVIDAITEPRFRVLMKNKARTTVTAPAQTTKSSAIW